MSDTPDELEPPEVAVPDDGEGEAVEPAPTADPAPSEDDAA